MPLSKSLLNGIFLDRVLGRNLKHALRRKSHTKPRRRAMRFEQFEDRRLLAQVTWVTDVDGFWDVGTNWSTGIAPGIDDDVIIDRTSASPVITIRSGTQSIKSIISSEVIALTGGTFN